MLKPWVLHSLSPLLRECCCVAPAVSVTSPALLVTRCTLSHGGQTGLHVRAAGALVMQSKHTF